MLLLTAYKRGPQRAINHPRPLQLKRGILSTPCGNFPNCSPLPSRWGRKKIITKKGKIFFIMRLTKEPRRSIVWGKRWECETKDGVAKGSTCGVVSGEKYVSMGSAHLGVGTQKDSGRGHESQDEEYDIDLITLRRVPRCKPTELDSSQQEPGSLPPARHDQFGWHWNFTTELDSSQQEPGPLPPAQHGQLEQYWEFSSSGQSKPNPSDIPGETPSMKDHPFDQTEITDTIQQGKRYYSQPNGSSSKLVSSTTATEIKRKTLNAGATASEDSGSNKEPRVISSRDEISKSEADANTSSTHSAHSGSQKKAYGKMVLPPLPPNPTDLEVDSSPHNLGENLDTPWKTQTIPSSQPTQVHTANCESTAMSGGPVGVDDESCQSFLQQTTKHRTGGCVAANVILGDPAESPEESAPLQPSTPVDNAQTVMGLSDTVWVTGGTVSGKAPEEIATLPSSTPIGVYDSMSTSKAISGTLEITEKAILGGPAQVSGGAHPHPSALGDHASTSTVINETVGVIKDVMLSGTAKAPGEIAPPAPAEPYGHVSASTVIGDTMEVVKNVILGDSKTLHAEIAPLPPLFPAEPCDHSPTSTVISDTVEIARKNILGGSAEVSRVSAPLQFSALVEPSDNISNPAVISDRLQIMKKFILNNTAKVQGGGTHLLSSAPVELCDHAPTSTVIRDTVKAMEGSFTLGSAAKVPVKTTPLPSSTPLEPYDHASTKSAAKSSTSSVKGEAMLGAKVHGKSAPLHISALVEPCDHAPTSSVTTSVVEEGSTLGGDSVKAPMWSATLQFSSPVEPYDHPPNSVATGGNASVLEKMVMVGDSAKVTNENATLQFSAPVEPYDHPSTSMVTGGTTSVVGEEFTIGDFGKVTNEGTPLQFSAPVGSSDHSPASADTVTVIEKLTIGGSGKLTNESAPLQFSALAEPYDHSPTAVVTSGTASVVEQRSTIGDSGKVANGSATLQPPAPVESYKHSSASAVISKTVSPAKNAEEVASQAPSKENEQVRTVMESPVEEKVSKSHRLNIGLEKTRDLPDTDIHSPVPNDTRKRKIPKIEIEGEKEKRRNIIAAEPNVLEESESISEVFEKAISLGLELEAGNLRYKESSTAGFDRDYEWLGTEDVSAEDALKPMDLKVDSIKPIPSTTIVRQTISEVKPPSAAKPPSPPATSPQNYYILVWNQESGSMHFATLPSICQCSTRDDTAFDALRNLNFPESFLPLWRVLQMEGFTVIGGEKDCLILKVDAVGSKAKQLSVLKEIKSKLSPVGTKESLEKKISGNHSIITSEAVVVRRNVADGEIFHENIITEQTSKKVISEVKWVKTKNRPFRSIFWAAVWVAACSGAVDVALEKCL